MGPAELAWIYKNFLIPSGITAGIASLFGSKGSQATPMTPEEKELNDAAAKVNMALSLAEQASTGGIASEGLAPEAYLLDALNAVKALPDSGLEFFGDTKDKLLQAIQNVPGAIKKVPGALVEGTADLGNVIFQGATLGKGPQLEAVIPNLMDILNGGIGGTLVLGGGQTPTTILGTGQTGVGRGTKVTIPLPVIGPILDKIVTMRNQGATLADIIKSIPSGLYDNLPQILSGAAAAGLMWDEDEKATLVGLGVEPSILGGTDNVLGGTDNVLGGTDNVLGGTDNVLGGTDNVLGGTDLKDAPSVKVAGKPVLADAPSVKVAGKSDLKDAPSVKVAGKSDLADAPSVKVAGKPDLADAPSVKVAGKPVLDPAPEVKVDSVEDIIYGPMSDAEISKILTDIGGQPAVKGGYDTPPIKTSPPIKTGGGGGGGGGGGDGGGNTDSGVNEITGEPGELVSIERMFNISGPDIFNYPELTEEEEDELLYPYTFAAKEGGAVKRFDGGGSVNHMHPHGMVGPAKPNEPFNFKSFMGDNAAALIGGGIGALFGASGGSDGKNPSGYQGGIPEYTYNRTLKDNAFAPTMLDAGQTVARRPGSTGRSYFNYPETGPYSPIMESRLDPTSTTGAMLLDDEGNEQQFQRTMGGAARRAAATQDALELAEQQALEQQIGTGFVDAYTTEQANVAAAKLTADEAAAAAILAENTRLDNLAAAEQANQLAIANVYGNANTQTAQIQANALAAARAAAQPAGTGTGTGTATAANSTDPALNTFISPYLSKVNANSLQFADVTALADSGFTPAQIDTALNMTPGWFTGTLNSTAYADFVTAAADAATAATATNVVDDVVDDATDIINGTATAGAGVIDGAADAAAATTGVDVTGGTTDGAGTVDAVDALLAYNNIAVDQVYDPAEISTVTSAITDGLKGTADVAQDFGVGETDVWGALLRQGAYTPETLTTYIQQANPDYTEVDLVVRLLQDGQATAEEVAAYYQSQYPGITAEDVKASFIELGGTTQLAQGGMLEGNGYYLGGATDGMADQVPATIGGAEPARLSDGEFVVPADVVSHLGNGNSQAGSQQLYSMMDRIRKERTGTTKQGVEINPMQQLPA
jgi:hypothetical protein